MTRLELLRRIWQLEIDADRLKAVVASVVEEDRATERCDRCKDRGWVDYGPNHDIILIRPGRRGPKTEEQQ